MRKLLLSLLLTLINVPAFAQQQAAAPLAASGDAPIEITADEALEWRRADLKFIARVNAIAKQGDVSLQGDTLVAEYREGKKSEMEIWRVTAEGNVMINSQGSIASGDHAVYNLDDGIAVMTGRDLKLVSPDQTVTAKEKFEYSVADGKLVATGKAKAVRPKPQGGQDTLEAEKIAAVFAEDATGKRVLSSLEATDNVVITTPEEVLTGARGFYSAQNNLAELAGNVKIRRGENVLTGEKAQVNLATNVSTMLGGGNVTTGSDGRVRGIFYPGSERKPETQ